MMSNVTTYSNAEMLSLTQAVVTHLEGWQLSPTEMINVLGLPSNTPTRRLQQYRNMVKSFEQTADILQRIDHIVGIADALRTSFPFSADMRFLWLRKPHRRFRKQKPLEVIFKEGINGLQRVRIEVDCAYGWKISEAMMKNY